MASRATRVSSVVGIAQANNPANDFINGCSSNSATNNEWLNNLLNEA